MRSRYSAYCIGNYQYILDTYAAPQRRKLTIKDLENSSHGTRWTALVICSASMTEKQGDVEFKAYYRVASSFYLLHEASKFIKEGEQWLYTTGNIKPDSGPLTVQRNAPCPCGSQLKYKRCCGK